MPSDFTTPRVTAKGMATRQRILDAAAQAFAQNGYERTRVADIAKLAGISHGNFYRHFNDKDDALEAALHAPLEALRLSTSRRSGARAAGTLEDLVEQSTVYFRTYAQYASLFSVMREAAARGAAASFFQSWIDGRQRFVSRTERWLETLGTACRAGGVRDRRMLAESLGAMTEQMAYVQIGLAHAAPTDDQIEAMGRCCGRVWFLAIYGDTDAVKLTETPTASLAS